MLNLSRRSSAYFFTVLACGALATVGGCGSKGVVGKWTGTIPGMNGTPTPMAVEFKSDGTEDQTATIMGHAILVHSAYTIKGDTLSETITSASMDGKAMPAAVTPGKTQTFTYKLDGDSLTLTSTGKPPVVLKRADK